MPIIYILIGLIAFAIVLSLLYLIGRYAINFALFESLADPDEWGNLILVGLLVLVLIVGICLIGELCYLAGEGIYQSIF